MCNKNDSKFARVSASGIQEMTLFVHRTVRLVDRTNAFRSEKPNKMRGQKPAGVEVALLSWDLL